MPQQTQTIIYSGIELEIDFEYTDYCAPSEFCPGELARIESLLEVRHKGEDIFNLIEDQEGQIRRELERQITGSKY